jgi:small subunit ribosomal protein S8e
MKQGRKITGGKYHAGRKTKKFERRNQSRIVKLAPAKIKKLRTLGGNIKLACLSHEYTNMVKDGKTKKVKIKNVVETKANRFFARQNVIVKGAIIETEIGNAIVTNRPSQEGTVQSVFVGKN